MKKVYFEVTKSLGVGGATLGRFLTLENAQEFANDLPFKSPVIIYKRTYKVYNGHYTMLTQERS